MSKLQYTVYECMRALYALLPAAAGSTAVPSYEGWASCSYGGGLTRLDHYVSSYGLLVVVASLNGALEHAVSTEHTRDTRVTR